MRGGEEWSGRAYNLNQQLVAAVINKDFHQSPFNLFKIVISVSFAGNFDCAPISIKMPTYVQMGSTIYTKSPLKTTTTATITTTTSRLLPIISCTFLSPFLAQFKCRHGDQHQLPINCRQRAMKIENQHRTNRTSAERGKGCCVAAGFGSANWQPPTPYSQPLPSTYPSTFHCHVNGILWYFDQELANVSASSFFFWLSFC